LGGEKYEKNTLEKAALNRELEKDQRGMRKGKIVFLFIRNHQGR